MTTAVEITQTIETPQTEAPVGVESQPDYDLVLALIDPKAIVSQRKIRPVDLAPDFLASVKKHGVLEPVTVREIGDGRYDLVFGNHRHAAALEAEHEQIPALVRTNISSTAVQLIQALSENIHRTGMKASEIAAVYDQLALEGLDVAEIAAEVAQDEESVRESLRLHKLPKVARDAADLGQLSIEQGIRLAEFEDDPKEYAKLLKTVKEGGNLRYALDSAQTRRVDRERKAESRKTLLENGIALIPKPEYGAVPVALGSLKDPEGETYNATSHAACAGHAAYLDERGHIVYVCREPKRYEHEITKYYTHLSAEESAAKAAEAEAEAQRQESLRIAAKIRMEFITKLARANKTPKGLYRATMAQIFGYAFDRGSENGFEVEVFRIIGASPAKDQDPVEAMERRIGRTPEHRLPLLMFAQLAVQAEANLRRQSYWFNLDWAIAWLELVEAYGHPLAEPEIDLLAELREKRERRDNPQQAPALHEDDEDEDEDEEDDEDEVEETEEAGDEVASEGAEPEEQPAPVDAGQGLPELAAAA
ncbi:ParB/RepB/Spo0J family partition protein [Kitasatospora sp. NPDC001261]|uniref:ParB/RepB/Spo0J family partition protein n=1 Tax=Kitasatospora sp. NPDC001261 TaxID=3364012 RepID=UPI003682FE03